MAFFQDVRFGGNNQTQVAWQYSWLDWAKAKWVFTMRGCGERTEFLRTNHPLSLLTVPNEIPLR
jgi:hypothetical protein